MMNKTKAEQINDILPQTQCGLCSYKGCKPYAVAIAEQGDAINRCPPGGVRGLIKLAELTNQGAEPFIAQMRKEQKPRMLAVIREDECIGCTKCIQACPVDAILGASKVMHSVISDECSGCELCVEPCPVDCIDMVAIAEAEDLNEQETNKKAQQYRRRYEFRETRLQREAEESRNRHKRAKHANIASKDLSKQAKLDAIAESVARAKERKNKISARSK